MAASPGPTSAAAASLPRFRLGTRGSALAVAQSSTIAEALRSLGAQVELVTVRTLGDDRPPDTTWGEGAFVGALEGALLDRTIDLAVHSAKDVPTTEPPGLVIAAYPPREDPRDALVGRAAGAAIATLPQGARVGTDSPRRSAFLRAIRPDLLLHPLHGNVDTRLRRLDDGDTDALVLAVAGLNRLGRSGRIGAFLPADLVPPAPGQGALAVQCRADDDVTRAWIARLDDPATRAAVEAERGFLRATGGGCRAPIGALGRIDGDEIVLSAGTAGIEASRVPHGERPAVAWGSIRGPVADRLSLAAQLAARLTAELAGLSGSTGGPSVLVTRAATQSDSLVAALAGLGVRPTAIPTIEIRPVEPGSELDAAIERSADASWVVVTSVNSARATLDAAARLGVDLAHLRWAAIGGGTAAVLAERGIPVAFRPSAADSGTLAAELPLTAGDTILLPRADIADVHLVETLVARGARVDAVIAYRTIEAPETSRERLRALFAAGAPDAIVFTSGSTVRGLLTLLGAAHQVLARTTLACCIGDTTAAAARDSGFEHVLVAPAATPADLAGLIHAALVTGRPMSAPGRREEDPT